MFDAGREQILSDGQNSRQSFFLFAVELLKIAFISLAIIIPVRYFLIQPFYVKGASMEPSFHDNEYLIINEIGYRVNEPKRGDIVVFKYPKDPTQYFIKRIIALPGERIVIKDGDVRIYNAQKPDGAVLDESEYLLPGVKTGGETDLTLEKGEYFVMGDNRDFSMDSRMFGSIETKSIIGKAMLRGWPLDKLTYFETPYYSF